MTSVPPPSAQPPAPQPDAQPPAPQPDAQPESRPNPQPNPQPVVVRAPAKLTLWLHMVGLRDDGYHLLDAEMVSLELADALTFTPRPEAAAGEHLITVSGPFAAGVPTDASNLAWKALDLAAPDEAWHVDIGKHIPHGGGLGGGSTDAATVLRWAGWPTDAEGLEAASRLGADIPFCLVGGRARVRGIGERVDPLPPLTDELDLTLVIPPLHVSTPAAYRAFDELHPSGVGPASANDLESAALRVEPRMAWWRDAISERLGTAPTLAGSGATWFAPGKHDNALADLVDEGGTIVVTRTATSTELHTR